MSAKSLGIVGTGLIGASVGLRARELGYLVTGYDVRADSAELALRRGALDAVGSREDAFACDVVVLATPVDDIVATLASAELRASRAELILDVGSVKAPIVAAAHGLANFVATHPLAGSERSGPGAAKPTLFSGRSWVYVPSNNPALDAKAAAFIRELGANARPVEADAHDRIVARTSHVPQLLAWMIADRFESDDPNVTDSLMGPVARELARIAQSDRALWRTILTANAANVAAETRALARALDEAAAALDKGEAPV